MRRMQRQLTRQSLRTAARSLLSIPMPGNRNPRQRPPRRIGARGKRLLRAGFQAAGACRTQSLVAKGKPDLQVCLLARGPLHLQTDHLLATAMRQAGILPPRIARLQGIGQLVLPGNQILRYPLGPGDRSRKTSGRTTRHKNQRRTRRELEQRKQKHRAGAMLRLPAILPQSFRMMAGEIP